MLSFKQFTQTAPLLEGGAFGHLSNPHEENSFSFGEFKGFISDSLKGKLDVVELKTDATNLSISWIDGELRAARNKGHLKNSGATSLNSKEIGEKFAGRDIGIAYVSAMHDLNKAILSLTQSQRDSIFGNGRKWMSTEVMGMGSKNIIDYQVTEIRLHGTTEYDDGGDAVSPLNKAASAKLVALLKPGNADRQETWLIKDLDKVDLKIVNDYDKLEKKYHNMLAKVVKKWKLKSSETISDLKVKVIIKELDKFDITPELGEALVNRWVNFIKQPSITALLKGHPQAKDIKALDKTIGKIIGKVVSDLDEISLGLGSDVLAQLTNFMATDPSMVKASLQKELESSIKKIKSSGNEKAIIELERQLIRLQQSGGIANIVPEEGVTFFYKGKFLKFTGSFAPVNQIINTVRFGKV